MTSGTPGEVPVIVNEQLPDERSQVGGFGKETEPEPPDCEKETVPLSDASPEMLTVQVVDPPSRNDEGAQETFVVVAYLPVAFRVMLPPTSV